MSDLYASTRTLVGRARELALLDELAHKALLERGSVALIAGEAGIGKSRLAREAAAHSTGIGFVALRTECLEASRSAPYGALFDLIESALRASLADAAETLGTAAPVILRWMPELSSRLQSVTPATPSELQSDRQQFFRALTEMLAQLTRRAPLHITIEDLHWCDEASLDYLLALASRAAGMRLVLALSYRSEEPSDSLQHFLSELDRRRLATELLLAPLTRTEMETLIGALLEAPAATQGRFEPIAAWSEGNPLLIEELLKVLRASGDLWHDGRKWVLKPLTHVSVPRTVQDAVRRRVVSLGVPARGVLEKAAVIGHRFRFGLLEEVTAMTEASLLAIVRELLEAQLLVEGDEDQFAFRHALMREAVYSSLLFRQRRSLHRLVAEALKRHGSTDAELSYHYYQASEWNQALHCARAAGEDAMRKHAARDAVVHFTRALDAAGHLPATETSDVIALLHARGQAHEAAGDFDTALADYLRAQANALTACDAHGEWQSLLDLGFLWASRDYARSGDYYAQALALARRINDQQLLAQSLNRLGNWCMNVDQPDQALEYHQEALDICVRLNDRKGMADTLDLLGITTFGVKQDLVRGTAYYERAIQIYRELDDRRALVSCLATLCMRAGHYFGDLSVPAVRALADVEPQGDEALALARAMEWQSGEAYALTEYSASLAAAGNYRRALANLQSALATAREIEHHQWEAYSLMWLGAVMVDVLAFVEARKHLERAREMFTAMGAQIALNLTRIFLSRAMLYGGDHAGAEAVLQPLTRGGEALPSGVETYVWFGLAEIALRRGDPARTLEIADRLSAGTAHLTPATVIPRLWLLRAEALAARGRLTEAESFLIAGSARAREQGARPLLWRLLAMLARVLARRRQRARAETARAEALDVIGALAEDIPEDTLRANFRALALAQAPSLRPPSALRVARQASGGLTAREREIARLVSQGLSNQAIAVALVVSERTVEAHISHILAKLGMSTRAQIAAWAARRQERNGSIGIE